MRLRILNMPHQTIGQEGIKIETSIIPPYMTPVRNQTRCRGCLNQDGRVSSVNKISLPNLPI